MVIFHSYVSLPEGNGFIQLLKQWQQWKAMGIGGLEVVFFNHKIVIFGWTFDEFKSQSQGSSGIEPSTLW